MSKATEWAQMAPDMRFEEMLPDDDKRPPFCAVVSRDGNLVFSHYEENEEAEELPAHEALRFARWILDTFGNTP